MKSPIFMTSALLLTRAHGRTRVSRIRHAVDEARDGTVVKPPCTDRPISQVRLVEYPAVQPATAGFKVRRACAFISGRTKPLSPAKPQQPTSGGTTTVSAHACATAKSFESSPMRRVEHVGCSATGSVQRRAISTLGRTRSCRNSAISSNAIRPAAACFSR